MFTFSIVYESQKSALKSAAIHIVFKKFPQMTSIIVKVLLTTPITIASAETSFSNLKFIKNVLCSTMSNEWLSALGIISLRYELAKSLDFDVLVDKFAQKKDEGEIFLSKVYAITN